MRNEIEIGQPNETDSPTVLAVTMIRAVGMKSCLRGSV